MLTTLVVVSSFKLNKQYEKYIDGLAYFVFL